jgi:hypothetical protein
MMRVQRRAISFELATKSDPRRKMSKYPAMAAFIRNQSKQPDRVVSEH